MSSNRRNGSNGTFDFECEALRFSEKRFSLTDETTCGLWILRGDSWQKFANKKVYAFLYGGTGLVLGAIFAYFNGTISTLEKRYKIPSRNTGIISIGNDISLLLAAPALTYYAGKGHRPRWMAFGLVTIIAFCMMNILPHWLYGPGEDALSLTVEYGKSMFNSSNNFDHENNELCSVKEKSHGQCNLKQDGNTAAQVILFVAQFICGVGISLFYTLGISYMDDNVQKSQSPMFVSITFFMRLLGPAIGYTIASMCLKLYISPTLTPTVDTSDPRWLGAWWLGWSAFAAVLIFFTVLIAMFPKTLPRTAARRRIIQNAMNSQNGGSGVVRPVSMEQSKASTKDMINTFKRLLRNKTFMCNNLSTILYVFGYTPYWIFTPKYIETQYRKSASTSNLVTGTVALVFSAIGVLSAGFFVSRYKPRARYMAMWNILTGGLACLGCFTYNFLGCGDNERGVVLDYRLSDNPLTMCNANCSCDFVKYSPVCGNNGLTYISGCHAGCREQIMNNGNKIFIDCSCIAANGPHEFAYVENKLNDFGWPNGIVAANENVSMIDLAMQMRRRGMAISGACPVSCQREFIAFLAVMCGLKFIGSLSRATNFLVSVRCVREDDKSVAMGFSWSIISLLAQIPGPIFFGWILDRSCIVWGKTCSETGNCWLYDGAQMRWTINTFASIFMFLGMIFDVGVWYYVKDLQVFDDEKIVDTRSSNKIIDESHDSTATK